LICDGGRVSIVNSEPIHFPVPGGLQKGVDRVVRIQSSARLRGR
jgi:hypothetical protein